MCYGHMRVIRRTYTLPTGNPKSATLQAQQMVQNKNGPLPEGTGMNPVSSKAGRIRNLTRYIGRTVELQLGNSAAE